MHKIEVVIPTYKAKFLALTLDSLCNQTCKDFGVVIADDASPEPIREICARYVDALSIKYVRFDENIGSRSLAAHFNRAVGVSSSDWILLAGDDDIIGTNVIEQFFKELNVDEATPAIFSLNVERIDDDGVYLSTIAAANSGNAEQFLSNRFSNIICPVTVGYIFSKAIFSQIGGFELFDKAWHSDDALWALMSTVGGLRPIKNAKVFWRQSRINISSLLLTNPVRYAKATIAFTEWLNIQRLRLKFGQSGLENVVEKLAWNTYGQYCKVNVFTWLKTTFLLSSTFSRYSTKSTLQHAYRFAKLKLLYLARGTEP